MTGPATVSALRQLRQRTTLGGSTAAAACGVDPFLSPVMLWAQLTGRAERPETEAMHFGKRLERVVWEELEARGYGLLSSPQEGFVDPERKWLVGHPDGFATLVEKPPQSLAAPGGDSRNSGVPGDDQAGGFSTGGVLEIKTANQWAHRAGWSADAPLSYQAQAHVYMHLTGRTRTLLACLVGGARLELRTIERDEAAIGLLLDGMERFMRFVRRDRQPPADGSDSTRDALVHHLYPEAEPSKLVRLDREHWQLVRELRARKEQRARIDAQIQEHENRLKAYMGDAELAISPHDTDALRWTNVRSARVDTTALREQRPEVAAEYEKVTTTRRFTLL
jgi:predicted phage-related endonuclease